MRRALTKVFKPGKKPPSNASALATAKKPPLVSTAKVGNNAFFCTTASVKGNASSPPSSPKSQGSGRSAVSSRHSPVSVVAQQSTPKKDNRSLVPVSMPGFLTTTPEQASTCTKQSMNSPTSVMANLSDNFVLSEHKGTIENCSQRLTLSRKLNKIALFRDSSNKLDTIPKRVSRRANNNPAPESCSKSSWDPFRYSYENGATVVLNRMLKLQKERERRSESNHVFLALKRDKEKNEFKTAKIAASIAMSQELQVKTSKSLESTKSPEPQQKVEVFPSLLISEGSNSKEFEEDIVSIIMSTSESYDSYDGSDCGTYYSEMESIGETSIDDVTARLIEAHKLYQSSVKSTTKKSCFKVIHEEENNQDYDEFSIVTKYQDDDEFSKVTKHQDDDELSIVTEIRRGITWYDDEENWNRPFTLKSDESFDSLSLETRHDESPLDHVAEHLLPLASSIGGLFEKIICSGTESDL